MSREETKGRFCERAVLANVPSFRFLAPSFRFFVYPRSGFLVPSFRFLYPCSGFCQARKRHININFFGQGLVFCLRFRQNMALNWGITHFSAQKRHDQFWSCFFFLPFSLLLPQNSQNCCFCLSRRQKGRQKTRPPPFFCPVGLGTTPGLSRGFHRVCPWDKSGENLGQTRVFSLFYTVEARFHRVCPRDKPGEIPGTILGTKGGTESLCEKSLCAFFARYFGTEEPPPKPPFRKPPFCEPPSMSLMKHNCPGHVVPASFCLQSPETSAL